MSKVNDGITVIFIIRRIGSVLAFGFFFFLFANGVVDYVNTQQKNRTLKKIYQNGVSQEAVVDPKMKTETKISKSTISKTHFINYSFTYQGKKYKNQYKVKDYIAPEGDKIQPIAYFLPKNPKKSTLNIDYEIEHMKTPKWYWLIVNIILSILFFMILLSQIIAFFQMFSPPPKPITEPKGNTVEDLLKELDNEN